MNKITRLPKRPKKITYLCIWIILGCYIYELIKYSLENRLLFFFEDYSYEFVYRFTFLIKNHTYENLKYTVLLMCAFIPLGLLFPLAKHKRCLNKTLIIGELLMCCIEWIKYKEQLGIICVDDLVISLIGTYIGYVLFIRLSLKTSDGYYYLNTYDNESKKGWLGLLILFLLINSFLWNLAQGNIDISGVNNYIEEKSNKEDNEYLSVDYNNYYYENMLSQIRDYKTRIVIIDMYNSKDDDVLKNAYTDILNNNPDIFWLSGGASGMKTTSGTLTTYSYNLDTFCDMNKVPSMKNELDSIVNKIVNEAEKYQTDYEKALYVHDVLVSMCEYDIKNFFISSASNSKYVNQMIYTSYGCLVEKKAVCSGYAKAYQLIMNNLGIECGYVTGVGTNSAGTGDHAWNYILLDGKYYYVDVTWDDPVSFGYTSNEIRHDYFAISKAEISKDHTFDEGQFIPE